ncbi:type II toxin-antitoxin system HipA family toxin [Psychrobium sp. 1_MG-2023]|uniref:type II toxin-antitoxin system HipA family toxin n=1 Tax=Psychrobium sp. 1_MG-2023 TaxID=3062624 RepID=UPI000C33714A|nr:type II toxin-antitoxin system HipA family toxin [Psychrobium sp. 1_MG-2023]MDP2561396.1 type II toxin-antitoxin system HipA family toxin [Psychrobium sp. 1_MG-2023]PKF54874.1 toxin HipA [Alteromonadales bacterium alter-6D02]
MAQRKLNSLALWMNGELVGHWRVKSGVDELQYADEWLTNPRGRPLSLSLPFTPGNQIIKGEKVSYYFDNLLPDSRDIRERLAKRFNTGSVKVFDLLVELGRDCVGAIQLLPEGHQPKNIKQIQYKPLDESKIAEKLTNVVNLSPLAQLDSDNELRISLAGAQEKTALLWHNNQWCEPLGETPTTHIFKLPMGLVGNMKADMQSSVENEWLCSKIMPEFGIPIAHCDIGIFEGTKALIVERFDRKLSADDSWIIRLPQEDFCQAKGVSSLLKYQSDGGINIDDCIKLLSNSNNAKIDKQNFFKAQIIFFLLAATDGHTKNFSITHLPNNQYKLTPLYDVLSIHPLIGNKANQIAKQKVKMAMAIRGSKNYYHLDKIQYRHFIKQGTSAGFTEQEVVEMINTVVNQVDLVIENVSKLLPPDFPKSLFNKITTGMKSQAKKLDI